MAKTVRKFLIGDLWRIGAYESWFSHMASKGLHLKKVGLLFAHFSKGKPKDIRYRIDTTNKSISAEQKEFYDENGIDRLNEYSSKWSPFAPLQYESYETGLVSDEAWKDGSGVYSPSIHTQVYKLVFPSMGEDIVSDLIARNDLSYLEGEPIRQESEQFDTLFISESDGVTEVFAAKGKGVIYVHYFGYADMDVLVENVKEKIDLISE